MPNLKSFVQSQLSRQHDPRHAPDWTQRKEKWLAELRRLLDFIQGSLIEAGFPERNIHGSIHRLDEDTLGEYEAPGLRIDLPAGGQIAFVPIASVIVGGHGRVDVVGARRARFMLIADDAEERHPDNETPVHLRPWMWEFFAPSENPRRSRVRLDEQGLAELMERASDGR